MFIEKLFSPKWKHKNSTVRLEAIQSLNPQKHETQSIFAEVIKIDSDMSIRRYVVRRFANLDALQEIRENDPSLAEEAKKTICQLFAGNAQIVLGYEKRLSKFAEARDQEVIEYVAKQANEAELRKMAVEKIQRQSLLGDLAVNDVDQDVRLAALGGITQLSTLERVYKNSRTKDKRVSSAAKQRLDAIKTEQEKPLLLRKEAKQRLLELDTLVQSCKKSGKWQGAEDNYQRINQSWDSIIGQWHASYGELGEEITDSFTRLSKEFEQCLAKMYQEQAEKIALEEKAEPYKAQKRRVCEDFLNKISELKNIGRPDAQTAADLEEFIKQYNSQWDAAENELRKDKASYDQSIQGHEELNDQYYKLFSEINDYKKDLNIYLGNTKELNGLLEKSNRMLSSGALLEKGAHNVLLAHLGKMRSSRLFIVDEDLTNQVKSNLEKIKSKIDQQIQQVKHDVEEFIKVVADLEIALKSGKSKQAVNLSNRGKKLLHNIPAEERKKIQKKNHIKRFNEGLNQLSELQSWRQWSSAPIKEKLYKEMDQLAEEVEANSENPELDFHDVAQRVRAAREEWKKLSAAESDPAKELWELFDSACTRAYAPCQEYFKQQAGERTENLHKREAACASLEEYLEALSHKPSDLIDWKALEQIIRVAQNEWHDLGVVNRKDKDAIYQRFRDVVNALRKLVLDKKLRNQEEKENLIDKAGSVAKQLSEDKITLHEAIQSIKQIQAEWKNVGIAAKDGRLWKTFRGVCDEIFSRRDQQNAEVAQQRQQILDSKTAVCENIENLAMLEGEELKAAQKKLAELKKQWEDLPKSSKQAALDKRYQQACSLFEEQNVKRREHERQLIRDTQQQRAEICLQAEVEFYNFLAQQGSMENCKQSIQELENNWVALPEYEDSLSKTLWQRFTLVKTLLGKCEQENIDAVQKELSQVKIDRIAEKELLCLQTEVLAKIDSPPEAKQARMEYQISQLADQMKQSGAHNINDQIEGIQQKWHLTGIVDSETNQSLENRFNKALRSLLSNL